MIEIGVAWMKSGVFCLAAALLMAGCANAAALAGPVGTAAQTLSTESAGEAVSSASAPGTPGQAGTPESSGPAEESESLVPERDRTPVVEPRYPGRPDNPDTAPKTAEILKARYIALGYAGGDAAALIEEKGFESFQKMGDTSDEALRAVMDEYLAGKKREDEALHALTELWHFDAWQLRILTNAGYSATQAMALGNETLQELFAPGAVIPGDGGFEPDLEQHKELMAKGITDSGSMVLARLGYSYEEMLELSDDQIRFLLPNTELVQKLIKRGYPYDMVRNEAFVIEAGYSGYRELLDQAYRVPEGYRETPGNVQTLIPASYTAKLERAVYPADTTEVVLLISHDGPDGASMLGCPNSYRLEKWDELNGIWVQLNHEQRFPEAGGPFLEVGGSFQERLKVSLPADNPQGVYRIAGYFSRAVAIGEERSFLFKVE